MNEPTLTRIEGAVMHFSDGGTLPLPRSVKARAFGEGLLVWDLDGKSRSGRIAAGRTLSACKSMLDYVAGK